MSYLKLLIIVAGLAAPNAWAGRLSLEEVQQLADKVSMETGVSAQLLTAIAKVESGFNSKAIGGSHNEVGLMQLHPKYFRNASFDPYKNMLTAAKYLKKLKVRCARYAEAWFVCYNLGPNKRIKYPKKFPYYKKVINAKAKIEQAAARDRVRLASN